MLCLDGGVADIIAGGITGLTSGIASLFGADSQSRNVKRTNEMNYKIAKETNANQLQIARENNEMQLASMRENNQFNRDAALEMFNLENEYNLPENQVKRLIAAGINPSTMYGSGGVQNVGDASTPSASSSGISPSMPQFVTPQLQTPPSVLNGMFGNIESLTRSIGNVVRSGLDLASKKSILSKLGPEIDKIVASTEDVKIQNAWNTLKMNFDKINLPRRQEQEISELISKVYKNYAEGGAAHALIAVHDAEAYIKNQEGKRIEEQRPVLLDNLRKLGVVYDEQAKTEQHKQKNLAAGATASYSQADLNRQLVNESVSREKLNEQSWNFINDTYSWAVAGVEADTRSKQYQNMYDRNTLIDRIEQVKKLPGLTQASIDELNERVEALRKSNSWFNVEHALHVVRQVTGAYKDISDAGRSQSESMKNTLSTVPYYLGR